MSDTSKVTNLHTGAPVVPAFQDQHREQPQRDVDNSLLDRIIARTVETVVSRPSPFGLNTFEDVAAFAERLHNSSMCPKSYKESKSGVDDIVIAILMGKELRPPLSPMMAVQSIAVVNGRPTLWGEAVPGICIASGQVEDCKEWFEGDEQDAGGAFTAVCEVTRKGFSPRQGRFSRADVQKAGLKSVHLSYPRDMLMWRARHRAWHGVFPDILRGLGTAEIEADLANQPSWTIPRPSRSDTVRGSKATNDSWDDAWFDEKARELFEEQDPWAWLGILQTALKTAPSLRDIKELESLGSVARNTASAPAEVKETIAKAFVDAEARFNKPPLAQEATGQKPIGDAPVQQDAKMAETKAALERLPPAEEASQTFEFEYAVLDETGEPIDGVIHVDPIQWARAFAVSADPTTMAYMAMREHNADAMLDAGKHPTAKQILDDLEGRANIQPANPPPTAVIEPALVRGRPDWTTYLSDFAAAIQLQDAKSLHGWVELQRERVSRVTQATRMQCTKIVIQRAKEIGIAPPPGFAAAEKPAATEPDNTAAPPADTVPANAAVDKDAKLLETFVGDLAAARNVHEVRHYTNQATVTSVLARWDREEKTELATALRSAAAKREAELTVAA